MAVYTDSFPFLIFLFLFYSKGMEKGTKGVGLMGSKAEALQLNGRPGPERELAVTSSILHQYKPDGEIIMNKHHYT